MTDDPHFPGLNLGHELSEALTARSPAEAMLHLRRARQAVREAYEARRKAPERSGLVGGKFVLRYHVNAKDVVERLENPHGPEQRSAEEVRREIAARRPAPESDDPFDLL